MDDSLPVTLIVKAPNQQVADQTVRCHPHWTIRKLKGHLSEVYPCKPKSEEQKLIYSGQLLSDTLVLKDVLRKYEGQDTHTVHLVCTSPQAKYAPYKPKPSPTSEPSERSSDDADGLRRRNVGEPTSNDNNRNSNNRDVPNAPNPFPYGPYNSFYWSREQMDAWNAQMTRWAAAGYGGYPPGALEIPEVANADPMMFAAQIAWMQQMRMQQMQQYYTNAHDGAPIHQANAPMPGFNGEQIRANVRDETDADRPVRQREPANVNNDGNEGENRDWLDWFYNLIRLSVMASIVYFYSSPMRFLIVLMLGATIYLFQTGHFIARINNERNERRQDNEVDDANDDRRRPGGDDAAAAAVENEANPSNRDNLNNNNDNRNEISFFAIAWTVFASFFTSLIPETPNAVRN